MCNLINKFRLFLADESGTETVEWAIVAGLIIIAAAATWGAIGNSVSNIIGQLANAVSNAE